MSLAIDLVLTTPGSERISNVELHPVKPWAACVSEKTGEISIWDYKTKVLVHKFGLSSIYETKRDNISLQRLVEKNEEFKGEKYEGDDVKFDKVGDIIDLKFFDADVVFWKLHEISSGEDGRATSASAPPVQPIPGRWLAVLTEQRLVLVDYETFDFEEIRSSQVDGKTFAAFEFLYTHPMIAFAGSDGVIRLWNMERNQVAKRLSAHTRPPTKLIVTHREFGISTPSADRYPLLVSGGPDSSICAWDIDRETAAVHLQKTHEGQSVLDIFFDVQSSSLISVGENKSMSMWSLTTQKELAKFRPPSKKPPLAACVCRVPSASFYFVTDKTNKIYRVTSDFSDKSWNEDLDVAAIMARAGTALAEKSSALKVYGVRVHPLVPNIVFAATSAGLVGFTLDVNKSPVFAVGATVLAAPTEPGLLDEPVQDVPKRTFYYVSGSTLVYRVATPTKGEYATFSKACRAFGLPRPGVPTIGVSPSGKFVSLVWEESSDYEIYSVRTWKSVSSGKAQGLVWYSHSDIFAILRIDTTSKGKEPRSAVGIHQVADSGSVTCLRPNVDTPFPVRQIFGGYYLGVSYWAESGMTESFQFYTWDGASTVGGWLPQPRAVHWAPTASFVLLVFPNHIAVFTCGSGAAQFKSLCFFSEQVESAVWSNGTLFLSTPDKVKCYFPATNVLSREDGVVLASHDVALSSPYFNPQARRDAALKHADAAWDPLPQTRPRGSLSLIDVVDDYLYVLDMRSRMHRISLAHPALKCRMLLTARLPDQAISWLPHIDSRRQDDVARFMANRGMAREAVSGLPQACPLLKMRICFEHGLDDATLPVLRSLDALLAAGPATSPVTQAELSALYLNSGMLLQKNNRLDMAEKCLQKASALDPRSFKHLLVFYARNRAGAKLQRCKEKLITDIQKLEQQQKTSDSSALLMYTSPDGRNQSLCALDQSEQEQDSMREYLLDSLHLCCSCLNDASGAAAALAKMGRHSEAALLQKSSQGSVSSDLEARWKESLATPL